MVLSLTKKWWSKQLRRQSIYYMWKFWKVSALNVPLPNNYCDVVICLQASLICSFKIVFCQCHIYQWVSTEKPSNLLKLILTWCSANVVVELLLILRVQYQSYQCNIGGDWNGGAGGWFPHFLRWGDRAPPILWCDSKFLHSKCYNERQCS